MIAKHPKFNALDEVIKDEGWKIVVMLRLTPIPFNLLTYFFSVTSISLHTLLLGTVAGVFPGSSLGIWIGSMLQGLSGIDNVELEPKNVVILIMNGAFIVCSILTLSIFGKRSLRKAFSKLDHHQGLMSKQVDQDNDAEQDRIIEETNSSNDDLESGITTIAGEEGITTDNETEDTDNEDLKTTTTTASTGFTHGEKLMFVGIGTLAIVNICVSIPLYFHFANQQ
ncbi:hypothetical protein BGZ76_009042 [Entomortierella beljakovae]|nr:hypothetical protein BGZ76_009042 [Entomortierella beljakovae]